MIIDKDSLTKEELLTLTNYLTTKSYEKGLAHGKSQPSSRDPIEEAVEKLSAQQFAYVNRLLKPLLLERDTLRHLLARIVYEYRNSYDADCEAGGSWKAAASLPVDLMERAAALVGAK